MKVQLPGKEKNQQGNSAIVRWQYNDVDVHTKNGVHLGTTQQTTCIARVIGPDGVQIGEEVSASVKLYKYDVGDKDVARKESLRKVLDALYPLKKLKYHGEPSADQLKELQEKLKEENGNYKQYRALYWDAYLTRNDQFVKHALPIG